MKYLILVVLLVSCGKNEPLTKIGRAGEEFVQNVGKGIEGVGQVPRTFVNLLLGIDEDTDEELKDAINELEDTQRELDDFQDDVVNNEQELEEIRKEIEELKSFINTEVSSLSQKIFELESKISKLDQIDREEVDRIKVLITQYYFSLLQSIGIGDTENLTQIRSLLAKINVLEKALNTLEIKVNDLLGDEDNDEDEENKKCNQSRYKLNKCLQKNKKSCEKDYEKVHKYCSDD